MSVLRSLTQKTIAISPFSGDKNAGHPLVDDQFYFSYLLSRGVDFVYYAAEQSAVLLRKKFPEESHRIRVVSSYDQQGAGHYRFGRQIKVPSGSRVIFFGYLEHLVFVWYILNLLRPFSLYLVSSNNISARRVRLYPWRFRLFFALIWPRFKKLVLDTNTQIDLVRKVFPGLDRRCFVRKHHLMSPVHELPAPAVRERIIISYFGPEKPEKPLAPIVDLIQSAATEKCILRIYNVGKDRVRQILGGADLPEHVEVREDWLSRQEYIDAYIASDLVLLTHTKEFEGKLSGNLCDCVSFGTPFISRPMSPVPDLLSQYGVIGYVCDYETLGWSELFACQLDRQAVLAMKVKMRQMAQSFSEQAVRSSLDQALS